MRIFLGTLAVVGLASIALAQSPGQPVHLNPAGQQNPNAQPPATTPVKLDPTNNRLDALLLQWEAKMKAIGSLEASVARTETDPVDKSVQDYKGTAKFMRPDRAMLYLQKVGKPEFYEHYIYTGNFLYELRPQNKHLRIHELNPKPGQIVEDNFLNFLFGMKAEEAKRRYDLTLVKEDQHYIYIFVDPKTPADRAEFTKARLVLWATTFLPRQLEFELPNKGVIKWDIPMANPAGKVTVADFNAPQVPKDWQVQRIPRQTSGVTPIPPAPPATKQPPPTKVRPTGG